MGKKVVEDFSPVFVGNREEFTAKEELNHGIHGKEEEAKRGDAEVAENAGESACGSWRFSANRQAGI